MRDYAIVPSDLLLFFPELWRWEIPLELINTQTRERFTLRSNDVMRMARTEYKRGYILRIDLDTGDEIVIVKHKAESYWFDKMTSVIEKEFNKGENTWIHYTGKGTVPICQRRIVASAWVIDNNLIVGARHGSPVMNKTLNLIYKTEEEVIAAMQRGYKEGFIDQYDVFWERDKALTIAICAGQMNNKRTSSTDVLWSEDVW